MAIKTFQELGADEIEDFASACTKRKLIPADFEVRWEENYQAVEISPIDQTVNVKRKSNGAGKEYHSVGSTRTWTADFLNDLLSGAFD